MYNLLSPKVFPNVYKNQNVSLLSSNGIKFIIDLCASKTSPKYIYLCTNGATVYLN